MFVPLSTMFGPRLPTTPARLTFPSDPAGLLAAACDLDRQADLHLAEGRGALADTLAHLAIEYRARANGGRA